MISQDRTVKMAQVLNIVTFLIAFVVFLSVCTYIDPFVVAVFMILFVVAMICEYQKHFLPRILLNVSSLVILGLFFYRLSADNIAPLTVEALLLFMAVKLLEKKRFRDYVQTYLISVFLLSGGALLGISLAFLSYVIILVFLFNGAMIIVAYYKDDPTLVLPIKTVEKIVWKGSLIPICAIPLAVLIFIITPRSPLPILDFLNQKNRIVTGFSDRVSLGKVSEIQEDGHPIFRAAMEQLPEGVLYWRGMVLDYFDGSTWSSANIDTMPEIY